MRSLPVIALLGLLACGGTDPAADDEGTAVVTAVGAPTGPAVSQTVGAAGGTVSEPQSGASLRALAGSFAASAAVTLVPVENLFPGGVGDGVSISVDQPLARPLVVELSYGPEVLDPSQLGVALQLEDGSWVGLGPVRVDPAKQIISVVLTDDPPVTGRVRASRASGVTSQTIVKYLGFGITPDEATVKVTRTVDLVPYALIYKCELKCVIDADGDCLSTLCPRRAVRRVPFTNDKPGYFRRWEWHGPGTLVPKEGVGATYTAPGSKPSPNVVDVLFISLNQETGAMASANASITIAGGYLLKGTFTATQLEICAYASADLLDHFQVTIDGDADHGYVLSDFQNEKTQIQNVMHVPGGTVTADAAFDIDDVKSGMAQLSGGAIAVVLMGDLTSSRCTYTDDTGTTTVPSQTLPYFLPLITFDPAGFVDGTQTLPPIQIPNSGGAWTITIDAK